MLAKMLCIDHSSFDRKIRVLSGPYYVLVSSFDSVLKYIKVKLLLKVLELRANDFRSMRTQTFVVTS